eukprot:26821_5
MNRISILNQVTFKPSVHCSSHREMASRSSKHPPHLHQTYSRYPISCIKNHMIFRDKSNSY